MADIVYECAVNKSHPQKKFVVSQVQTPVCCQKPMVLLQAPAQSLASEKPQATTAAAGKPKYAPSKATTQKK